MPGRAAGLTVAASALLTSFVLHAPPAAAHGPHGTRHTARPAASRTPHRLPTARPEPGDRAARPPTHRHPGRRTPPATPLAKLAPHPGATRRDPVPTGRPRPERISQPPHHPRPTERPVDAEDAVPPDPWQDLDRRPEDRRPEDQRLEDQRPDQDDQFQADEERPYRTGTVAPPAQPSQPTAPPAPASAVPSVSATGTADLSAASAARRSVGPALNILRLGTGLTLTGLGLGFMALRLRRR
ncbi:hypothetical protein ACFOSC_14135 [Streptantibioticus rubrisoli]|uniref:Uncharacterized protein n=1 Tax=Streptantibioticus rubrisoli TaxID=1387313 RepID=A0ABT1PCM9_9ACTN|nr:hypothetical protein [Streptantibioticus rubrisoli]MCQ4042213.1 hypothetical protein [Streptantibioticus rubrisoli]